MSHLISYGMISSIDNCISGNLVKAQCDICGKKFGSVEEARKCEMKHFENELRRLHND